MLQELGKLADSGRLKNFTALAEAVMRVDETLKKVEDKKAIYRVARLLDSVFGQAYRGEKSLAFLTERVKSVVEVLELMAMQDPAPRAMEKFSPDPARPDAEEPLEQEPAGPETEPATATAWDTMWKSPSKKA